MKLVNTSTNAIPVPIVSGGYARRRVLWARSPIPVGILQVSVFSGPNSMASAWKSSWRPCSKHGISQSWRTPTIRRLAHIRDSAKGKNDFKKNSSGRDQLASQPLIDRRCYLPASRHR